MPVIIPDRTVFRDQRHEQTLCEKGYVVLDFLTPAEMEEMSGLVRQLGFARDHPTKLRITITQDSVDAKTDLHQGVAPIIQQATDRFLNDYLAIRMAVFDKLPGGGAIRLHQHPHRVDESMFRSITIWCPLTDISADMGALHVVSGSHKVFVKKIRSYNDPTAFGRVSNRLRRDSSVPLEMKRGEAVIFDDRLLHWSPPNTSSRFRTAVMVTLIPREADLTIYYRENERELFKYRIDRETYRKSVFPLKERPDHLEKLGSLQQPYIDYKDKSFKAMMGDMLPPDAASLLGGLKSFLNIRKR